MNIYIVIHPYHTCKQHTFCCDIFDLHSHAVYVWDSFKVTTCIVPVLFLHSGVRPV